MTRKLHLIALSFFLLAQVSCEVPETVDLPTEEPRLVLNFISEDSAKWHAQLTQSKGVLEWPEFQSVPGAIITIYEEGQLLEKLQYVENPGFGYYQAVQSFPKPGKAYSVEAVVASFPVLLSEYVHPTIVQVDGFQVELLAAEETTLSQKMKFRVTFTDPTGENYYSITITQKSEDSSFPSVSRDLTLFYSNPAYNENRQVFTKSIAFSDELFEGSQITLEFESLLTGYSLEGMSYFTVSLQNMSNGLYNYLKTVHIQELSRGEPFAQPVIISNNIQNGVGVFGGFTVTQKTLSFE